MNVKQIYPSRDSYEKFPIRMPQKNLTLSNSSLLKYTLRGMGVAFFTFAYISLCVFGYSFIGLGYENLMMLGLVALGFIAVSVGMLISLRPEVLYD
jgi:hypothetical protein